MLRAGNEETEGVVRDSSTPHSTPNREPCILQRGPWLSTEERDSEKLTDSCHSYVTLCSPGRLSYYIRSHTQVPLRSPHGDTVALPRGTIVPCVPFFTTALPTPQ